MGATTALTTQTAKYFNYQQRVSCYCLQHKLTRSSIDLSATPHYLIISHEPVRDLPTSYLPLDFRLSSTAYYPEPHTNHTMSRSRSGSATSNVSNKELPADSMAIQVTISGGKTIKLNVRPVHTISNVLEFLSPSTTVAELKLEESSTLQLSSPSRSTTPTQSSSSDMVTQKPSISSASTPTTSGAATPTKKKSNKPRCSKGGCKAPAQPIVGDCGFCQKRFCGKHRMLESHNCEGLEDARRADKDRNAAKLEGEQPSCFAVYKFAHSALAKGIFSRLDIIEMLGAQLTAEESSTVASCFLLAAPGVTVPREVIWALWIWDWAGNGLPFVSKALVQQQVNIGRIWNSSNGMVMFASGFQTILIGRSGFELIMAGMQHRYLMIRKVSRYPKPEWFQR